MNKRNQISTTTLDKRKLDCERHIYIIVNRQFEIVKKVHQDSDAWVEAMQAANTWSLNRGRVVIEMSQNGANCFNAWAVSPP